MGIQPLGPTPHHMAGDTLHNGGYSRTDLSTTVLAKSILQQMREYRQPETRHRSYSLEILNLSDGGQSSESGYFSNSTGSFISSLYKIYSTLERIVKRTPVPTIGDTLKRTPLPITKDTCAQPPTQVEDEPTYDSIPGSHYSMIPSSPNSPPPLPPRPPNIQWTLLPAARILEQTPEPSLPPPTCPTRSLLFAPSLLQNTEPSQIYEPYQRMTVREPEYLTLIGDSPIETTGEELEDSDPNLPPHLKRTPIPTTPDTFEQPPAQTLGDTTQRTPIPTTPDTFEQPPAQTLGDTTQRTPIPTTPDTFEQPPADTNQKWFHKNKQRFHT